MADTNQILRLAAIIREVDGTHSKGAASLAESILNHPDFRAALADEPPEPIPPAALPEGYIDPEHSGDDRALLQTFYSACQAEGGTADEVTLQGLRAVLARRGNPTPQPPADGEVAELVTLLTIGTDCGGGARLSSNQCRRAADLLQRWAVAEESSVAAPVPVSERLPEPEDCDAEWRCWWAHEADKDIGIASKWVLLRVRGKATVYTHWLPAHALPLPGQEVGE